MPVLAYKINKYSCKDLKISGTTEFDFEMRVMVRDDYGELVSIVNKGIDAIKENEKKAVLNKWINVVKYQQFPNYIIILEIIIPLLVLLALFFVWNRMLKREIKKREYMEEEFRVLATTDRLTSIFNRYKIDNALNEQIEIATRYSRPLSLIFFDLDHFKKVNDRYGHKSGDLTLVELSYIVRERLRKSDIFGRWGGEEFLIILPETKLKSAMDIAEKLRQMIENNKFKKIDTLTCSFGVVELQKEDDFDRIMMKADRALYQAKSNGRNRVETL